MLSPIFYIVTPIILFICSVWTASTHNTSLPQQQPNQPGNNVSCATCKRFPQEIFPPLHKRPQLSNQSSKHVTSVTTETMISPKNTSIIFASILSLHKETQWFLTFSGQNLKKMHLATSISSAQPWMMKENEGKKVPFWQFFARMYPATSISSLSSSEKMAGER